MDALRPYSHGMALAGAGGGGFMYVISKEPSAHAMMKALIAGLPDTPAEVTLHDVVIDSEGLVVTFE